MKLDLNRHGYAKCVRCGCLRPKQALLWFATLNNPFGGRCADDAVCTRLAGVGKGELDGGGIPRGPELDAEVKP